MDNKGKPPCLAAGLVKVLLAASALSAAGAFVPLPAGQAFAQVQNTPVRSERLTELETEAELIRARSEELGGSRSPADSIDAVQTDINNNRQDIYNFETIAEQLGITQEELEALRAEARRMSTSAGGTPKQKAARKTFETIVKRALSQAAKRFVSVIGFAADAGEEAALHWIRNQTLESLNQYIRQNQVGLGEVNRMLTAMYRTLGVDLAKMKELRELHKRILEVNAGIALERKRLADIQAGRIGDPAVDDADTTRDTDPAGDEEEWELYLDEMIRPVAQAGPFGSPSVAADGSRICGSGAFYIPGTDICMTIGGGVRGYETGDDIGVGTIVFGGGNEPHFVRNAARLEGWGMEVGASFGSGLWTHDLRAMISGADGDAYAEEPIGGNPVAYTFGQDMFGSTGVGMGATGATATSELELRDFGLEYRLMRSFDLTSGFSLPADDREARRSLKSVGLIASFNHTSLDHTGYFQNLSFPDDIRMEVDRSLDTNSFGIGPAIEGTHYFDSGWFVGGGANVQLVYRSSELMSYERITCVVCGMLPDEFDIGIDTSSSGFDWKAGLNASLGYRVNDAFSISLDGKVEVGGRDTIHVRANPADEDTGIGHTTATDWGIGLKAQLRF